ncbi:hypothetical protein HK104_004784 [Borealophlyctis nickersoniae]|nr:hypothetical protein HK104_004784 [Borealophlyctis nickersoniae]
MGTALDILADDTESDDTESDDKVSNVPPKTCKPSSQLRTNSDDDEDNNKIQKLTACVNCLLNRPTKRPQKSIKENNPLTVQKLTKENSRHYEDDLDFIVIPFTNTDVILRLEWMKRGTWASDVA